MRTKSPHQRSYSVIGRRTTEATGESRERSYSVMGRRITEATGESRETLWLEQSWFGGAARQCAQHFSGG